MYFDEVIRLHYKEGLGEDRISNLLPIGHTTASRWIAIFAKENGLISGMKDMQKPQKTTTSSAQDTSTDVKELQKRIKELEAQLLQTEIKAEFYDEMINVAEAKFKIPIRKKAGANQ